MNLMIREHVSSSHIAAIGYDPDAELLELEFLDGSIYAYYDIPSHVYDGLMSGSHGAYFNAHIKGQYQFQKI